MNIKTLALTATLIATTTASEASMCPKVGFEELSSYSDTELVDTYDKHFKTVLATSTNLTEVIKTSTRHNSLLYLRVFNKEHEECKVEQARVKRLLDKKGIVVDDEYNLSGERYD